MNEFINNYFEEFFKVLSNVEVTDLSKNEIELSNSISFLNSKIKEIVNQNHKIVMIGNGGSAGICGHQVIDYWKNGGIKSINFNDSSLLTCISNDFSFEEVFSKPLEMFLEKNDILYCFSSSGNSSNIINAAKIAREIGAFVVTFSGFESDNKLRNLGDLNFYVKSNSYGIVEISHLYLSHLILDYKLYLSDKIDIFNKNKKLI
jgi:D-sedoheptulose 7-phosphate isomerase